MERLGPSENKIRLPLGQVLVTPGAMEAFQEAGVQPVTLLRRHQQGDWGELDEEDKRLNDEAVTGESRILSAYVLPTGVRVWIITEWDRSATTFLLPSEY